MNDETMKSKIVISFAFVLLSTLVGCSTASKRSSIETVAFLQNVLKNVEQRLPELKSVGIAGGTLPTKSAAVWWHGKEFAHAGLVLSKNIKYHSPGEFPHAKNPVPFLDFHVTIVRYVSDDAAQNDLKESLQQRPAMTPSKEVYKNNSLYRYASGGSTICQSGLYIIEVNPSERAIPLTMKVLDATLSELISIEAKQ